MNKLYFFKLFIVLICFMTLFSESKACDRTSINITSVTYNGTVYTYTAQVCIGISPNWGATTSITIDAPVTITGITSGPISYSYNYCSKTLAYNGQPCAGNMSAGGSVLTANVNVTPSIAGGNIVISSSNPWLGPDDLRADCRDCGNSNAICFSVTFTTTAVIPTTGPVTMTGGEGGASCPDEIETTVPAAPAACTPPTISATVNSGASVTVCEGAANSVDFLGACSAGCTGLAGGYPQYSWVGPSYSSTSLNPAAFTPTAAQSGTYTFTMRTSASCFTERTINVNVTPRPAAALPLSTVTACDAVTVPINLTGTGPWTVGYKINNGATITANCASTPCDLSIPAPGGTITLVSGTVDDATTCASGAVTGTTTATSTNLAISPAAADWNTPTPGGTYAVTHNYTGGLTGTTTTQTANTQTNSTGGSIPNGTGATLNGGSITLSGLSGANTCPLNINSIGDICITYQHTKASRDLTATLTCTSCTGSPSITFASFDNTSGGTPTKTVCFSYGDVLNLLDGRPCNSTLRLDILDDNSNTAGTLVSWSVTTYNVAVTPVPFTYSWAATSGTANTSYLSCTNCLSPTFTAPASSIATGCYTLTVTDGQGCVRTEPWCYAAILPIVLSEFKCKPVNMNEDVRIDWITEVEFSNKAFVLERSADGKSFYEIHRREGKLNANSRNSYFHVDANPLNGNNYYRLRQEDFDGNFTYSEIELVNIKTKNKFNLYPNPASKNLNILLSSEFESNQIIEVKVIDMLGKNQIHTTISTQNTKTLMDITELAVGQYQIVFTNTSNGYTENQKIVVY